MEVEHHIDLVVDADKFAHSTGLFNEITDCVSHENFVIISLMEHEGAFVESNNHLFCADIGLNHIPSNDVSYCQFEELLGKWLIGRELSLLIEIKEESKLIFKFYPFDDLNLIFSFSSEVLTEEADLLKKDPWMFLKNKGVEILETHFSNGRKKPSRLEFSHPNEDIIYKRTIE